MTDTEATMRLVVRALTIALPHLASPVRNGLLHDDLADAMALVHEAARGLGITVEATHADVARWEDDGGCQHLSTEKE